MNLSTLYASRTRFIYGLNHGSIFGTKAEIMPVLGTIDNFGPSISRENFNAIIKSKLNAAHRFTDDVNIGLMGWIEKDNNYYVQLITYKL